jgi:fructan beta-fructosidase
LKNINAANFNLTSQTGKLSGPFKLQIGFDKTEDFSIILSNSLGQKLAIGFDQGKNEYFIDRTSSGKVDFVKGFAVKHRAPRFSNAPVIDLTLIVDNASVELFADNGLTVMTEIFFPGKIFSDIKMETKNNGGIKTLALTKMKSIYNHR